METNETMKTNKSSTGLDSNIAGLLCYLFGWVTGLIFYLVEKDNKAVKFHAMQSILVFGGIGIIYVVISAFQGILWTLFWRAGGGALMALAGFLGILTTIILLASLILWIVLMIKAYQNECFKLPLVGSIAEKQLQ
jgi:uncharacterized membrane protein